jgi:hypothetical protein
MRTSKNESLRYWPTKTITISPAQVNALTTSAQDFTVSGLHVGDLVRVKKPTNQAGVFVADAWCATENTLTILFANCSNGALTPSAGEIYRVAILGST